MEIITANSLGDGRVVFQTPTGWSPDINRAELLNDKAETETAMLRANASAAANRVVEPYPIAVERNGPSLRPARLRERIRATGPTTGNSHVADVAGDEAA